VGVDDDRVPDQTSNVVVGTGALILLFRLDETLLGLVDLGMGFHLRHICQCDIYDPTRSMARAVVCRQWRQGLGS
jgi:hypothetical protein